MWFMIFTNSYITTVQKCQSHQVTVELAYHEWNQENKYSPTPLILIKFLTHVSYNICHHTSCRVYIYTCLMPVISSDYIYLCYLHIEFAKIFILPWSPLNVELLWKNYEALNFSNTFPMKKPFNYNPLKL